MLDDDGPFVSAREDPYLTWSDDVETQEFAIQVDMCVFPSYLRRSVVAWHVSSQNIITGKRSDTAQAA
jgi:hypothetical protein